MSTHGYARHETGLAKATINGGAGMSPAAARWLGGSVLHGCNRFHGRSVACAEVNLGELGGSSSAAAPGFAERFVARFVDIVHWPPGATADAGLLASLNTPAGASMEEVLLQAVLGLEHRLAFARFDFIPIAMATVEPLDGSSGTARWHLVWETQDGKRSLQTAKLALYGLMAIWRDAAPTMGDEFEMRWERLLQREERRRVSSSTAVVQAAAHARGLPSVSLGGPHLLLGQGVRQRSVYASVPGDISLAAARLSRNKRRTSRHLRALGLPVPDQATATTVESAEAAARQIGYPLAVKPLLGKQGGGVSVGVADAVQLRQAFFRAKVDDAPVLMEEFVPGLTYRLLVVGGRCVAALAITLPKVVGDGQHSIAELIEAENRDPLRNRICLDPIKTDDGDVEVALARAGLGLADVPVAGTAMTVRTSANVAVGGVHHDVTDEVHPSHLAMAERAAAAVGLEVAGIDVVSLDIALPCEAAGTRIIEVNARPGLAIHVYPRYGRSRDVAGAMLDLIFPRATDGHVSTMLLIGRRGAGALARSLQRRVLSGGAVVGLATRKQATVGEEAVAGEHSRLNQALAVLERDTRVQALIATTSPRRAFSEGLGLDAADVVALLPPDESDDDDVRREVVRLAACVARSTLLVQANDTLARAQLHGLAGAGLFEPARLMLVEPAAGEGARSGVYDWGGFLQRAWTLPD
ncbi:MAG: ATP-grasp domain-containing protein [Thiobacillus sp.]